MRTPVLLMAAVMGGLVFQSALALPGERQLQRPPDIQPRREERHDKRMGPGDAARAAQQQNGGGRVLDVNPTPEGYRVKVLKQGEVRVLNVPNQP